MCAPVRCGSIPDRLDTLQGEGIRRVVGQPGALASSRQDEDACARAVAATAAAGATGHLRVAGAAGPSPPSPREHGGERLGGCALRSCASPPPDAAAELPRSCEPQQVICRGGRDRWSRSAVGQQHGRRRRTVRQEARALCVAV